MRPEDEWLTGFCTSNALYQWRRCPFGLKNSGASFVRMMAQVLKPIQTIAEPYIDDVGVHSSDFSSHLADLVSFLEVMRKASITLNLKKTVFAKPEVVFVGHVVGSGKHCPDPGS